MKRFIWYGLLAVLFLASCVAQKEDDGGLLVEKPLGTVTIGELTTNQAMYDPGDPVEIRLDLKNKHKENIVTGTIEVIATHLEATLDSKVVEDFSLEMDEQKQISLVWESPKVDFKGYLLDIRVMDDQEQLLATETVGVDVSSTWTKFPRYGYVWDFTENVDTAGRIEKLNNYHLNVLQYYDWKHLHHKPIAEGKDVWDDWSGRKIYGEAIRSYIAEAHDRNMVNMAYNMAYAAVTGYEDDGVKQEWALYFADDNDRGEGHFKFKMSDDTPTGITDLYFFDMSNQAWQDYIFKEMNKVFNVFDFDGWHSDTVGDWGEMQTAEGEILYVTDTYTDFLNNAKTAIGDKYLVFNPVGAQGIENVNVSDVDVLYTEIWPWDHDRDGEQYDSYASLKKTIERARVESGGKSLVVPAYMNYDYGEKHHGRSFNTASVLLTGATVYASGGSRIELGNDGNMLSNEYFPAENLYMKDELKERIAHMYDFIVAYQNLLRDGQVETDNKVEVIDYENSTQGKPNTIWTFGKKDDNYEIVQMINLLGVSKNDWRASDGKKETPEVITDFDVKYYPSTDIESVWLASPDQLDGRSTKLSFEKGQDDAGNYVQFTLPSLEYWNMIYMK